MNKWATKLYYQWCCAARKGSPPSLAVPEPSRWGIYVWKEKKFQSNSMTQRANFNFDSLPLVAYQFAIVLQFDSWCSISQKYDHFFCLREVVKIWHLPPCHHHFDKIEIPLFWTTATDPPPRIYCVGAGCAVCVQWRLKSQHMTVVPPSPNFTQHLSILKG